MPNPLTSWEAIRGRLGGSAPLSAHVGQRIWPDASNQDPPLPFIVGERSGAGKLGTLTGDTGLRRDEYTLEIFAVTAAEQQAIGLLIEGLLDSWRDLSVGVQGCWVTPGDSQETEWGRTLTLNVAIWFRPVP